MPGRTRMCIKGISEENIMKKTNVKSPLLLFLAAVIWGVAFVAQSVGMEYVGPFTFNAVRSIIGGLVLIPCIFLLDHLKGGEKKERVSEEEKKKSRRTLLRGGICCGLSCPGKFLQNTLSPSGSLSGRDSRRAAFIGKEPEMDIDLVFKIAATGIIVAVLNQLLIRSGREDQAMMTTLAGLIVVLTMLVQQISNLFVLIKALFDL